MWFMGKNRSCRIQTCGKLQLAARSAPLLFSISRRSGGKMCGKFRAFWRCVASKTRKSCGKLLGKEKFQDAI
jgi:hypothetical protein